MESRLMKLLFLLIFVCLAAINAKENIWNWQNPLPTGNELFGISFPTKDVGYFSGYGGTIIKYNNGKMELLPKVENQHFTGLHFFDEMDGLVLGYDDNVICNSSIFKTTDGGINWEKSILTNKIASSEMYFEFVSEKEAYIYCFNGWIFKSTDYYKTWYPISEDFSSNIYGFQAVNDSCFYMANSDGKIFKSKNPEKYWDTVYSNSNSDIRGMSFSDEMNGIACGYAGLILRTYDGGKTWHNYSIPNLERDLISNVKLIDSLNVFITLSFGRSAYSNNGGINWTFSQNNIGYWINNIAINENEIWTVGQGGTICKVESYYYGLTLQNSHGYNTRLEKIEFADENNGFAIGDFGHFLKTTNGGETWEKKDKSGSDIHIFSKDEILVPNGFQIFKSTDGGDNFEELYIGYKKQSYNSLKTIDFGNETVGFCGGDNGTLIKSTNGGNTWLEITSPTKYHISKIDFLDDKNGLLADVSGTLFKTTNSGESWTKMQCYSTAFSIRQIKNIHYTSKNNIKLLLDDSVLVSYDWGYNFSKILNKKNDLEAYFISSYFMNDNVGWVVSAYPTVIRKTIDGGLNWEVFKLTDVTMIFDVFFINENRGWMCGLDGAILHTNRGGISKVEENIVENNNILVYPNPASEYIEINYGGINPTLKRGVNEDLSDIKIYNTYGENVITVGNADLRSLQRIDISHFTPGVYFVKIGGIVEKFVKFVK